MGRMHNPPHPGEVLREFLPEGMTIENVARRLGVSRVSVVAHSKRPIGDFRRHGDSAGPSHPYLARILALGTNKVGLVAGIAEAAPAGGAAAARGVERRNPAARENR